jgi:spore maturation protein CgeB
MAAAQMSLSVLIVGQSVGWSLENSYAKALKGLGWMVNFWNPQEVLGAVSRGARLGRLFSTFVNVEPWLRKANLELLKTVDRLKPNLVLVIATEGIRAGTLGQLRAQHPDTLLYCLFPDTPHNLVPDRILSLPFFDRVMTVSPNWMDAFARAGAKRVNYLPLAADPDLHHPPKTNPANSISAHDVAFIGIWRPEREAFLDQLTDFDLCVWGSSYWKRNASPGSRVPSHWGGRALFGAEFSQACANSRILLNMIDGVGWPGPNMRTFEQPACRAFSMVTRTPAVLDIFKEGETIECFGSVSEVREKIEYYLTHEDERRRIADAAYDLVINGGHTYLDRARTLIEWAREDGLSG